MTFGNALVCNIIPDSLSLLACLLYEQFFLSVIFLSGYFDYRLFRALYITGFD